MWPINVRRDRGSVIESVLLLICAVRNINKPLWVRVPKVAMMRWAKMDLVLAQWRLGTRPEVRNDLLHTSQV